jgi:hypothetical protein
MHIHCNVSRICVTGDGISPLEYRVRQTMKGPTQIASASQSLAFLYQSISPQLCFRTVGRGIPSRVSPKPALPLAAINPLLALLHNPTGNVATSRAFLAPSFSAPITNRAGRAALDGAEQLVAKGEHAGRAAESAFDDAGRGALRASARLRFGTVPDVAVLEAPRLLQLAPSVRRLRFCVRARACAQTRRRPALRAATHTSVRRPSGPKRHRCEHECHGRRQVTG